MSSNSAIGRPNCFRLSACSVASLIHSFIPPTHPPPSPERPLLRTAIAILNPFPSSPSRFSPGIRTFWNETVHVPLARIPILSSFGPVEIPSQLRSTRKAESFPSVPSVRANTVKKSAKGPFVIQIFSPVRSQLPSACLVALVLMEPASEPDPDSVRQKAAIISPVESFGRYCFF